MGKILNKLSRTSSGGLCNYYLSPGFGIDSEYLLQFSSSLKMWEDEQIAALIKCKYIHCDETSTRIDKVNWWVHSYSSGDITLKLVHRNRGKEAMDEM